VTRFASAVATLLALAGAGAAPRAAAQQDDDAAGDRDVAARHKDSYPRLPSACTLASPVNERYAPGGTVLDGDRLALAFLVWEPAGGDQVALAEVLPGMAPRVVLLTTTPGECFWPQVAAPSPSELLVVFVRQQGGVPELVFVRRDGKGIGPVRPLAKLVGCLSRPALAVRGGKCWIAFENRGEPVGGRAGSDVWLAPLEGDRLGAPVRAGDGRFGDLEPALAVASDGALWLAWTQWQGRDFEVVARRFDPESRALGPVVAVSADPLADDFHPSLAVGGDGRVWLAWDVLDDPRRGRSSPNLAGEEHRGREASLALACVDGGSVEELVVPEGAQPPLPEGTRLSWSGALPRLALDPAGRLLLAQRYFEPEDGAGPPHTYPILYRALGADGWSDAAFVTGSEGEIEEPLLAAGASGAWIVGSADDRVKQKQNQLRWIGRVVPPAYASALEARHWNLAGGFGPSRLQFAFVPFGPREKGGPPAVRARAPGSRPARVSAAAKDGARLDPLGAPDADPILNGSVHEPLAPASGGAPLFLYYGDLHRHSNSSRCLEGLEARPLDRYVFAREAWHDDFFALTDHPGQTDPLQAWKGCKLVDLAHSPELCVLQGFEWSNPVTGHQNVIFRRRTDLLAATTNEFASPEQLWSRLDPRDAITIPHHPGHAKMGMDWSHFDARFVRVVEVFQSSRGSYEFEGCFRMAESAGSDGNFVQDALDAGREFGLIASSDHGNGEAYAVALAERLDRDAIFAALRDRRTFASTTKGLVVDFRRDGELMGRAVKAGGPGRFTLDVHGTRALSEVVIFRNGEVVHALGRRPKVPLAAASGAPDGAAAPSPVRLRLQWFIEADERTSARRVRLAVASGLVRVARGVATADPERQHLHADADGPLEAILSSPAAPGNYRRVVALEFDVAAAPDAALTLEIDGQPTPTTLRALAEGKLGGKAAAGPWTLAPVSADGADPVALEPGLGVDRLHDEWVDPAPPPPTEHAWYYARVVDAAGETSWSSPIFVEPK
jgi:hypothetical protein